MDKDLRGCEMIEMGIQIEKNGRDFYTDLASRSTYAKAKELFEYLAGEEEKHISKFEKIREDISSCDLEPAGAYTEEYFAYMNSLASGCVFTQADKGGEIARNTKSDIEAIRLGIKFEKDSILLYEGMKRVAPADDIEILDRLIGEEKNHLSKLYWLQSEVSEEQ